MLQKCIIVFLCIAFSTASGVAFSSCHESGWICDNRTVVTTVSYTCAQVEIRYYDNTYTDYRMERTHVYQYAREVYVKKNTKIDLSEWSMPYSLTNLTIHGCNELTLALHTKKFTLEKLTVKDIEKLVILPSSSEMNPLQIKLEDIAYIEKIPARTIVDNKTQSVIFKNINIGLIEKDAISLLSDVEHFQWSDVRIADIMNNAVYVKAKSQASFIVERCKFSLLKPFSFHVVGGSVGIIQNEFDALGLAAIKVMSRKFTFNANIIMHNSSRAILVNSPDVLIVNNEFKEANFNDFFLWTESLRSSTFVTIAIKNNLINVKKHDEKTAPSHIITSIYEMNNSSSCFSEVFLKDFDTEFSDDVSIVTTFFARNTCANADHCIIEEKWRPNIQVCNTDSAAQS